MTTTLELAIVDTPDSRIYKAKVIIEAERVTVYHRRSGEVLAQADGTIGTIGEDVWTAGDLVIRRQGGCKCGGTTIEPKELVQ